MSKIKELRQSLNMTQTQFSEYLHIPFRTIQNWEMGSRKCPKYVEELIEYKIRNDHRE